MTKAEESKMLESLTVSLDVAGYDPESAQRIVWLTEAEQVPYLRMYIERRRSELDQVSEVS